MLACFMDQTDREVTPILVITKSAYAEWFSAQIPSTQAWLTATRFRGEAGSFCLIPDAEGKLKQVVFCMTRLEQVWEIGSLPLGLPEGVYAFEGVDAHYQAYAVVWGLGAYQFSRYKKAKRQPACLVMPHALMQAVHATVESIYLVRDCINTPTEDMGPTEFAEIVQQVAESYQAECTHIIGEALLTQHYPCIYTVGRACDDAPRLADLRWGNPAHPKITLVGKGVCFDTGGLDIKPSQYMTLMKKDMGGAANVLGLARMIMAAGLPIRLRVLIPLVENSIAGNAYRPGDVIISRKGLSIEVGNTDAEGRLVLADALTEAVSESPELLIDMATLTGAARVAMGPDLPAVFANNDAVMADLIRHGQKMQDPVWSMPLFMGYRDYINSSIADLNNNASESYGGAITAALFLKEFVPDTIPWLHMDLMAWNIRSRPGKPQGGEAMGVQALFSYLCERYGKSA